MKRFLSALLVVMMLVSMLPATVFAAETATAELSLATQTYRTSVTNTQNVYANNDITLTYNKGTYSGTMRDNAGDAHMRWYAGTNVTVEFPKNMTQIVFACVNSSYATVVVNSVGTTATATADGSNVTVELPAPATSFTIDAITAQTRVNSITVTYEVGDSSEPETPACTHESTQESGYVAPGCTTTGMSATVTCTACGEVVTAGEEIPATGHTVVDGVCSVCGEAQAATESATITFDDKAKRTTYTTEQQVWEENSIVVTNDKASSTTNIGDYANPARFYKGSTVTVAFPMNMTQILFDCGSTDYANALAASITGATASSDKVTVVLTTPATSFTTGGMSAQVRVESVTVTYEVEAGVCLHEETEVQGYVAPTCTTEGATGNAVCVACGEIVKESEVLPISHGDNETYVEDRVEPGCETEGATGITYCSACDEVVTESTAIPATGHSYDGDTCTVCGAAIVVVDEETYVFSNYTAGTQYAENEEHVLSDLVTMYTTQAHFTSDLRLYSSSSHNAYAIIQSQLPIKGISVNAGENADTLQVYGSNDQGATWTLAAEFATATSYTDYSASLASTPYTWLKLDVKNTKQVRIKSMTLQFVTTSSSDCTHELTETISGTAATCTTAGQEDTLTCLCGQNVQVGAEIPALGHSYDDDYCTRCTIINPEAAKQAEAIDGMAAAGDKVIFYHPSSKVAMAAAANGDRMGAVSVSKANDLIPYSATHTAVMTVEQVGDYYRFEMGGQYLTSGEEGSTLCFAALPAEGETDYTLWNVTEDSSYGVIITSVHATYNGTDYNQAIEYYQGKFYPYGYQEKYVSSYRIQLGLVNKITLTADVDGLTYEGNLYLDLNGYKATNVVADKLYVTDSSATAAAAGTGSLTTESEVVMDNTYEGVRYIALKDDEGVYTFHVLQLKLDNVTLRTNKAGIYYKASMACDEILAGQIDYHGVAVSIVGAPTADFENEENTAATKIYGAPESVFTSGSVTNIFRDSLSAEKNAARGEMAIYADSYIKLVGGTVLMGENDAAQSLKGIMDYLNTNYASLSAEDQANALSFYETWADSMTSWNLANLAAATLPETEEAA